MRVPRQLFVLFVGLVGSSYVVSGRKPWEKIVCPKGQFKCTNSGECLDNSLQNDNKEDCKDGTDESLFEDKSDNNWNSLFHKRNDHDDDKNEKFSTGCGLPSIPTECSCFNTTLECDMKNFTSVPATIHHRVEQIDLSGNPIENITSRDFDGLRNLHTLYLNRARLKTIAPRTFYSCTNLKIIYFINNRLEDLRTDIFPVNNRIESFGDKHFSRGRLGRFVTLSTEYLSYNELTVLKPEYFERLTQLKILNVDHNNISNIVPASFATTVNLFVLILDKNSLHGIRKHYFSDLEKLQHLSVSRNRITHIESCSFVSLQNLTVLSLFSNPISKLNGTTFEGLTNLKNLDLHNTSLFHLVRGVFDPLENIRSLNLKENRLRSIDDQTFEGLTTLEHIYFARFQLCRYALHVRRCEPRSDGISSKENLLENFLLRIMVWVVAILACFGNCAVLMGRFIVREDNLVHSFFIKNLSLADLLMGVYLFVIAVNDLRYRGRYLYYDHKWRDSWSCDICGLLSTVSSEVSVLTLTVITFDRYVCIMHPLVQRSRQLKVAYFLMGAMWTACIVLAVMPVVGLDYFGSYFYRNNAVCIPLLLHEPRSKGWEYSAFIFLGINMASFMFIAYAYVAMFVSIRKSRMLFRSIFEKQERCLMKRFFFIVITDMACWLPIVILKVAALLGFKVPGYLYGWVVVFILPVNCALNPLLYTLTTKMFKQRFMYSLSMCMMKHKSLLNSNSSVTSSSSKSRQCVQDVELENSVQSESLSNTWTGKMKYKYANGKVVYANFTGKPCNCGYRPVRPAK